MAATQTFALAALSQFVSLYEDALNEKADYLQGGAPTGRELLNWMTLMLCEDEKKTVEAPRKPLPPTSTDLDDEIPDPPKLVRSNAMDAAKMSSKDLKSKPLTYEVTETDSEGKEVVVKKSLDMPFLPSRINYSETCQAVCVNGGLFTPCLTRPAKDSQFCKACANKGFLYGKMSDRLDVPVGLYSCVLPAKSEGKPDVTKSEISFGTYINKRGLTREFVENLISETYGPSMSIPDHMWSVDKAKSKRTVKPKSRKSGSPSTSSDEVSSVESLDESAAPEVAKKPRGRPRKIKSAEELAAEAEAPKKKRGRPAKLKKVVEEEPSVEVAEKVPEKAAEEVAEKVPEKAPEKAAEEVAEKEVKDGELEEEEPEDEEEEEEATFFDWEGKQYAYTSDNTLYAVDGDDYSPCGSWDPEERKPVFDL